MRPVPSWKFLVTVCGLLVLIGALSWMVGNTDLATVLFVVALVDGAFIAAQIALKRARLQS